MKTIILAGGLGTRISEETDTKPKPMVLLDDKPILWHVMNIYASQGFTDFIIATGYKGEMIQNWVMNEITEDWNIQAIDTGEKTMTGGRIKKCMESVPGERVLATYGDGLGNVKIESLLEFHESKKSLATLTAVRPPARFGVIDINSGLVTHFGEKNQEDAGWINGGFFVLEPEVSDVIIGADSNFENESLTLLSSKRQLAAFQHYGFWQPMDTLREKRELNSLAKLTPPPWLQI